MKTFKCLLVDTAQHKVRFDQLYFIGALLQEKGKKRVFVKLDSRCTYYFSRIFKLLWKSLEMI